MSFKKYLEAADLAESLFGKLFGKKSPQAPAASAEHPEIDVIDRGYTVKKGISKDDIKDAESMARRLEPGNLYQVLGYYNGLINKSGYHYPPQMITTISQSQRANEQWNKEYREMFLKTYKTPAMAKMLLDKAFKEMGLPPVQKNVPEVEPEQPRQVPSFDEIVQYIKDLLDDERGLNKDEIKKKIKSRFPALEKADSRIGKAYSKATKSSLKLYSPPEEPKEIKRKGILKFPGAN